MGQMSFLPPNHQCQSNAGDIYLTYPLSLDAFVAIICYMYSFIFFYLVSSFISAMCCALMSIVQVAFVNPLINELCMYVQSINPNQWPGLILSAVITGLLTEGALHLYASCPTPVRHV